MKRFALYLGLATALVPSCSTQEKDFQTPVQDDVVFYASFEQPAEDGTRVYANEDLLLRWTADDRISIFNRNTFNQQYRFTGETGDNAGGFDKVAGAEFATGNAISHVVSVYPYQSTTKISESESLTLTLPAEQHYAESSFGPGASTMVSVTADNFLQYKTVGGYLRLRLYGDGVSVSSITLKGNDGEKLAGKATVTMPLDGMPTVTLAEDAVDQISLVCDTPVALGATVEEGKDFWLVVPPVSFSKGFTVTVSGKGGVFEKSTEKTVTIERNKLSKMAPIEVELTSTHPRNVIYYTSSDGNVITPNNPDVFGASILSNEYVEGLGVITFDGDVTSIGDWAFSGCSGLTIITIPEGVTSIGNYAFNACTRLTSITIPNSVTSIGEWSFFNCTTLTSITIPESVTSIGEAAFTGCFSLMSFSGKYSTPDGLFLIDAGSIIAVARGAMHGAITIPDGVTSIGNKAFYTCGSITSITIPESVTNIGNEAFSGCSSLASITIPENVTSIGEAAFAGCSSLMSFSGKYSTPDGLFLIDSGNNLVAVALGAMHGAITIPDGVTSIGVYAFCGCRSLISITIPDGVTSIEKGAFQDCSSLTSITIPDGVTNLGVYAFMACTSLTSITIPESVTDIGYYACSYCSSLTCITVNPEVPPTGSWDMFRGTNNAPIYVPTESVEAYKSAQYWSDYADRIQVIPSSSPSVPVPEAVDLGLPSGLKWASFNLGASKPEEYGDYYAWGDPEVYYIRQDPVVWRSEEKQYGYIWETYKWFKGSPGKLTKYCDDKSWGYNGFTDGKTVLDPEDDAARVNLGGKWRIPTNVEWQELIDNCTWTWTKQNGVNGRLVTARNGNSIFLPAAGARDGWYVHSAGSYGFYWSSSLRTGDPLRAWELKFNSGDVNEDTDNRCLGYSVRPVIDLKVVNVKGVSLNFETLSLRVGGTFSLTATVSPSGATDKSVIWKSYNAAVATVDSEGKVTAVGSGTTTIEVATVDGGYSAACVVTVTVAGPIIAYVDMGNGLKWATMNVGASSETDYGDYFAWGETEPKYESIAEDGTVTWKSGYEEGYCDSTYKWREWCEESGTTTFTKYNTSSYYGTVDNLTTLEAEDDAATVNWGGTWRTPTDDEWAWLMKNCSWTWTSDYNGSGVAGRIVTSKIEGYTSNSIFLPATGYWDNNYLYSAGTYGQYWSSSLYTDGDGPEHAWHVYFYSGKFYRDYCDRYFGYSVRPVSE